MNRDYLDTEANNVEFFIGTEIEKTHFYGATTLFVVGLQSIDKILLFLKQNNCNHIYLGANHCFYEDIPMELFNQIESLLEMDYFVTLDIPATLWSSRQDNLSYYCNHDNFCLNLSVPLPRIELIKNVCIKIDDEDFNATNSGVWVYKMSDNEKTNWTEYKQDVILKSKGDV